ncbi:MAG: nitrite reductase, copper-containing [Alphaproteobacteria bacterium]|nr:nitrite reductase, copper-containing [Alphaproteobacteria bacterium]
MGLIPATAALVGLASPLTSTPARAATDGAAAPATAANIARDPADVPAPIGRRAPQHVRFDLETVETTGQLADGVTYQYWTFRRPGEAPQVPGPLLRARVGDTIEIRLTNSPTSMMMHNIDLHAVMGPFGGSQATACAPGQTKSFTFKATRPGLFVYHCATPSVAMHISNGMHGMILIEPAAGLPKVDREFYIMQSEIYTTQAYGTPGAATVSYDKILAETPEYFVFNGAADALTKRHPLKGKVGETVRVFFGVGGPNKASSFHIIGQIMERLYDQASLVAKPLEAVQTTTVAPGGAVVAEFNLVVPGTFPIVDHAIARIERGAKGLLQVEGPEDTAIFNPHPPAA